jgi:shikimate dehydrogenase
MPRAAVIGYPLDHSRSPVLHRAAYAALGLTDWTYDKVECPADGVPDLLAGLTGDWRGLSVTMPCKPGALAVAGSASPVATAVGAANTLVRRPDGWYADNTDVGGIVRALGDVGVGPGDAAGAVVLGAGGTARAAIAALAELGVTEPVVLVREPARAADLMAAADRLGVRPQLRRGIDDAAGTDAPVLISTLPAGAADPAAAGLRPGPGVYFDVLYSPWPTALAGAALAAGRRVVSGRELLVAQALQQVQLMTGLAAPEAAMQAAMAAAT